MIEWLTSLVFKHPKRIVLVALVISIVGFLWQLLTSSDDSIAFSRSGAILVMLAITAVFFNHILGEIRKRTILMTKLDVPVENLQRGVAQVTRAKVAKTIGEDHINNLIRKIPELAVIDEVSGTTRAQITEALGEQTLKDHLLENPHTFTHASKDVAVELSRRAVQAKNELPELDRARNNISYAEFWVGMSGTFIWGFGDILHPIIITILLY